MFAAIQSAEPTALILWSVLAFAAGMYPVGLMLGSTCSPCCGTPCTQCTQGSLPDTVTVTLSGFPNERAAAKTCCGDFYNGKTVVLRRNTLGLPCLYTHSLCGLQVPSAGVGSADAEPLARITLSYQGPALPPTLTLSDGIGFTQGCTTTLTATQNVTDCSNMTFTLTNTTGATAQVVPGGTYDQAFLMPGGDACYICCKGEEPFASQAEFTVQDNRVGSENFSGTYVLPFFQRNLGFRGWQQGFTVSGSTVTITVDFAPCQSIERSQGWVPGFCNTCHNKCYFQVSLNTAAGRQWIDQNWFALFRSTAEFCESACEETPICSPYGRTWVLCRNVFPNGADCGDIVVTA